MIRAFIIRAQPIITPDLQQPEKTSTRKNINLHRYNKYETTRKNRLAAINSSMAEL